MTIAKKISAGLLLGAMSFVLVACGKQEEKKQPPTPASAVTVHKQEIPISYEYAARVVAYRETEVRARVGGIMLHRNFVEGSEVKQGDVLFEIDPDQYAAAVESARARVAQAQANYDQSVRDANRAEELVKQKVQSTAQRDQAFATRDADRAALMQAQADLRTAELNLQYTKVIAPISGLTSREAVSEGSLIGVDPSSSLLTTITQRDPVYVNFSFTDSEAAEMKYLMAEMKKRGEPVDNLKVTIHLGDGTNYAHEGTVDFTSPTIDEQTGTLGARAVVDNPDHRLVPGMFVRVTVTGLKMADATTIPESALMQTNQGQYVYVGVTPPPLKDDATDEEKEKAAKEEEQREKDGSRLLIVERRPVEAIRQLQDRSWLLAPASHYEEQVPVEAAADQKADKKDADAEAPAATPKMQTVTRIKGVEDGENVITAGQVYLSQKSPDEKPMVLVTPDKPQVNDVENASSPAAEHAE